MKTKIITLESHDDLISVRDKLSWAKTPRILLVWPKYEKVTLRLLDLKILQRHADSLGAQLGLVTRRMNVRRDAESLGIPVFKTAIAAQKDLWPAPAPRTQRTPKPPKSGLREMREGVSIQEPAWRTSLAGRVVAFTAGVLAVLVLAGLFIPRAALTLHPEKQNVSVVIPVNADPNVQSVSLTGELPVQTISLTLSHQKTVLVTSQVTIPKDKAKGVAQFKNLGPDEISIPAGTVVVAEGTPSIRFVTLNDTLLPGGVDKIVEVRIEALEAGAHANLETGVIERVEGPLGLSMIVSNPEPTIGGTDTKMIGPNENDRTTLRESLLKELATMAEEQARQQLGVTDLLLNDTLQMKDIQHEEFSPPAGEAGGSLWLSIQAEFTADYILAEDLKALAASSVTASIPQGFSPFGEMTFNLLDEPITDSTGVTHFRLQAAQTALREVNTLQVFNLIRGASSEQAKTKLQQALGLREEPQIALTPSWWKWLPLIPFNLSVEVK